MSNYVSIQTLEMDSRGSLTENELVKALEEVSDPRDKVEIKKIFNVLNSMDTQVNLQTFKQKVIQYNRNKMYQDKENCNIGGDFQNLSSTANFDNKMTFIPGRVSSPVISKSDFFETPQPSIHEETFESIGDDNSHLSDGEDGEASFSRPNHLRLSFRRSRRLSKMSSIISVTDQSPSPNAEDELEYLKQQLVEKRGVIVRCEAELSRESELVKTLEERAENTENTNCCCPIHKSFSATFCSLQLQNKYSANFKVCGNCFCPGQAAGSHLKMLLIR